MKHRTSHKLFGSKSAKSLERQQTKSGNEKRTDNDKFWGMSSDEALRVNYVDSTFGPTVH